MILLFADIKFSVNDDGLDRRILSNAKEAIIATTRGTHCDRPTLRAIFEFKKNSILEERQSIDTLPDSTLGHDVLQLRRITEPVISQTSSVWYEASDARL